MTERTFISLFFGQHTKDPLLTDILATFRNTLLPKLISGELRIPDAERFIEEAGRG